MTGTGWCRSCSLLVMSGGCQRMPSSVAQHHARAWVWAWVWVSACVGNIASRGRLLRLFLVVNASQSAVGVHAVASRETVRNSVLLITRPSHSVNEKVEVQACFLHKMTHGQGQVWDKPCLDSGAATPPAASGPVKRMNRGLNHPPAELLILRGWLDLDPIPNTPSCSTT